MVGFDIMIRMVFIWVVENLQLNEFFLIKGQ